MTRLTYNVFMTDFPLLKALVMAGLGSRRVMADAIKQERVKVNGNLATAFNQTVNTDHDQITLDSHPVSAKSEAPIYILLNKPAGVLCTTKDERGRQTVLDLLPDQHKQPGLYPVGRLDKDSRGLLLLTNDGNLTYRLTHPKFEKEKEYIVLLDRLLTYTDKNSFEAGLELEDGMTYPTVVKEIKSAMPAYNVILHEGRKRQLRRMFQSLGYSVLDLKRVRLGSLKLDSLAEGKTRELSEIEVEQLSVKTKQS
jgi:23S rRNA pseudouridine2605 synthase